jgi:protoporphyrinogen oxidase
MHTELSSVDIAIIGGGPCGLGAAWRATSMQEAGAALTYTLIESSEELGGSSLSVTTPEGFVFDYGGHILYPHANYPEFGVLIDQLADNWDESPPVRGVFYDGQLIPYPVQQNIHRLKSRKLASAVIGLGAVKMLNRVQRRRHAGPDRGLAHHLRSRFGHGLSKHIMEPINRKMWATAPAAMGSAWTSHHSGSKTANVADVSLGKVAASIVTRRDHLGWSPATRVKYPRGGGTGSLWKTFAKRLPRENIQVGVRVTAIDARKKHLHLSNGTVQPFERLISTMPLDELLSMVAIPQLTELPPLQYASASFVGLGIAGPRPAWLQGVHSFHLPDPEVACWRLSFPASLSGSNVPDEGTWSILCEISHNEGVE